MARRLAKGKIINIQTVMRCRRKTKTGRVWRSIVLDDELSTSQAESTSLQDLYIDSLLEYDVPLEEPLPVVKKRLYKERRERLNKAWEDQLDTLQQYYENFQVGVSAYICLRFNIILKHLTQRISHLN